jgi:hypothetical protein
MHLVGLTLLALGAAEATNPVTKVVELISGLKQKIQQDGKAEQALYDKYACWCEKTTDAKKAAIADAKSTIEELTKNILKLKGASGSAGADISFLKKNIVENKESTTKATEMRAKENKEFVETKAALELGMANLRKAIDVLGAMSKKTAPKRGFSAQEGDLKSGLITMESGTMMAGASSAHQLSAATDAVRHALELYTRNGNRLTMQDTAAMNGFLGSPVSMLQSPHKGAYETQSGAIQGILADMMDSFTRDYASNDEEEKEKQKEFDALIKTKTADLKALEKALTDKTMNEGDDVKQLATDQKEREETEDELAATEEFLETTIEACKSKADEWAERSRLRTEELAGMNEAIDILTSDTAKGTFTTAVDTFVQLGEEQNHQRKSHSVVKTSLKKLKAETTATPQKVAELQTKAKAAVKAKAGMKRFEEVQHDIDVMEDDLREEGMEDIKIKAHCDNERREVNNHQESLEFDMDALQKEMDSGEAKKKLLAKQIQHTTSNMQKLKQEMEEYLNTRNAQNKAFQTALKADSDAVMLLTKTIEALSKYAENNLKLIQKKAAHGKNKEEPEYTTSEDTAPEATFSSASSGGSETGGIVGIIENIKQDLEEEMAKAKEGEAKALQAYKDTLKESEESMAAMEKKIASMEIEIAETTKLVADKQETWDDKKKSHDNNDKYLASIATECDWMDENFEPRKVARDSEIEGLDDAKGALAGEKQLGLVVTAKRVAAKKRSVDEELKDLDEEEQSLSFLQRSK